MESIYYSLSTGHLLALTEEVERLLKFHQLQVVYFSTGCTPCALCQAPCAPHPSGLYYKRDTDTLDQTNGKGWQFYSLSVVDYSLQAVPMYSAVQW